jgi:uncharacterized membrane protein
MVMNASQIHLVLTHVPVVLSFVGLVVLVVSLLAKNDTLTKTAYYIFFFTGLFAIPVYYSGEGAEEIVEKLPGVSENIIEKHETLAGVALAVLVAGFAVSLGGLLFYKKTFVSKVIKPVMLLVAVAAAGIMVQTAHMGGQIRHSEIRPGFSQQAENLSKGEKPAQEVNQRANDDD